MEKLDFLAVGDIVTDAFIKLQDAEVNCDIDGESCKISMNFGDKLPYEEVHEVKAVGNSPNAGVSAHRLGLKSAIMTDIGDDRNGEDCLETLKTEGIDTTFVRTHKDQKTNYHYVLWFNAERTILVKHTEFEYSFPQEMPAPKWLYLSSLAENSLPYHDMIADYLEKNPETKMAFQPGTFQMKLGSDKLERLYKSSALFFCNKEEANRILKSNESDIKVLLENMRNLGPKTVVITDGPNGAFTYDGAEFWKMPMYPDPKDPVDRTGAGDSFSSTVTSALALGMTLPEALSWGPINSMSVVQEVGAQKGLLTREKLQEFLKDAPDFYKPEKF
jgi:ribokinase